MGCSPAFSDASKKFYFLTGYEGMMFSLVS